jgi:hypothetical protein
MENGMAQIGNLGVPCLYLGVSLKQERLKK